MDLNKYTIYNRQSLNTNSLVVCYDCLKKYSPDKIRDWCDNGQTAICPYCWDDSVLVAPECTDLYTEHDIIISHKNMHGLDNVTKTITFTDEETYSFNQH